jgi:nucleotide-binding universal stress UspA family protein
VKIILALDHSENSSEALRWVRRVEWPAGSRVIVMSAVAATLLPVSDAFAPEPEIASAIHDQQVKVSRTLVQRAVRTLRDVGLPAEAQVLNGDPREEILELARRERADLIVVGSRGRTGLTKLVLGSVSSHVVTHAPCTVTVVKHDGEAETTHSRRES